MATIRRDHRGDRAGTEAVYQEVRKRHQLILVGHGAAMETPADAQYMLDHT